MFDRNVFELAFAKALRHLTAAEKVTKERLKELSRTVLEATHETGDIGFVNRLVAVLSPVNKKVAVLFFKEFTGFTYDDVSKLFTKKSKKGYDAAHKAYVEFMEDPHNNIWSWADRNVEIEAKPFALDKVTDFMKQAKKKADKEGIAQVDILKAVFDAGFEVDTLIALMDKLGFDAKVEE